VAIVVLAWTTLSTGLVWQQYELVSTTAVSVPVLAVEYGPAFWLWTAYAYLLTGAGTLLLLLSVERARLFQRQTATLLVAVSAPWLGNLAFLSGMSPLDLTPAGFVVSAAVLAGGFSRLALLDISPATGGVARAELVERLPEAVLAVDDSGRIVDLNPSAESVLETTLDEAVGSRLSTVAPSLAGFLDDVDAGDADAASADFIVSDPPRQYEVRVSSLRDDRATGQLITLSDVTDRRRREREVAVLNRVLRHDLRNDVAVVENYATLLERDPGNEEYVTVLRNRAAEMYDLVETVRQVERHLDADEPTLATLNVVQLVRERASAVAEANPDATVETDLPADAWVRAVDLVGSALDNLIENAVEHNDADEPVVRVSVERVTVAGDPYVDITVADDGPPIGEDDLAVLLGEESGLDAASGLGLWLVNWIVTDSGGQITYEPNEPRGNVVTVRLRAPDDDRYAPVGSSESAEPVTTSRRDRERTGMSDRLSTNG
jgi:signal transduction histidine kinase